MSATAVVLSPNFISSLRGRKILAFLSHHVSIFQSLIKSVTFVLRKNVLILEEIFNCTYIKMSF